jgi:ribosomal-protein-alanine acetyltransferase
VSSPGKESEPRFTLTPARASDVPSLAEIELASTPSPWTESQLRRELSKPESRVWTARLRSGPPDGPDGAAVGFAVGWIVAGELQVAETAVRPDARRRGAGRTLLRRLLDDARAAGCARATLEVREGNAAARALYAAEGFVETSRRPRLYEGTEAAVLMERPL